MPTSYMPWEKIGKIKKNLAHVSSHLCYPQIHIYKCMNKQTKKDWKEIHENINQQWLFLDSEMISNIYLYLYIEYLTLPYN